VLYDEWSPAPPVGRLVTPGNAYLRVRTATPTQVVILASDGTYQGNVVLTFAARRRHVLLPGRYVDAETSKFPELFGPSMYVSGPGPPCEAPGRFDVKRYTRGADGAVKQLWIVFEQTCARAVTGEVRIGIPAAGGPRRIAPRVARWSAVDLGRPHPTIPVWVLAGGAPLAVARTAVTGPNAGEFVVGPDECSGTAVAAHRGCRVFVRFAPTGPGARTATLRITEAGGRAHDVALQAFSYGGRTGVTLTGEVGSLMSGSWNYGPPNAVIGAVESGAPSPYNRQSAWISVKGDTGDLWTLRFATLSGDLAPGHYPGAMSGEPEQTGPVLDVSGNGSACGRVNGEFTITTVDFTPKGDIAAFGASFEEHCNGQAPAFRGTVEYRVGDTAQPAPWMIGTQFPPPSPCGDARFAGVRPRVGTHGPNSLVGTRRADVLYGRAGDDVLSGRGGPDCLEGGTGDDVLRGGPGRDVLRCGPGRDTAYSTKGDRISGCERVVRL